MKKADVQQAVFDVTTKFSTLLARYEHSGNYPVNSAVEIRVTGLDAPASVAVAPGGKADSPAISALSTDELSKKNGWDVALWIDVLTIPGTANSNAFYAEFEAWTLERFSGTTARVLPEWSKGWGYTDQGPWTSATFFDHIRQAFTEGRSDQSNWKFQADALKKYDTSNLFTSPLLDQLFAT